MTSWKLSMSSNHSTDMLIRGSMFLLMLPVRITLFSSDLSQTGEEKDGDSVASLLLNQHLQNSQLLLPQKQPHLLQKQQPLLQRQQQLLQEALHRLQQLLLLHLPVSVVFLTGPTVLLEAWRQRLMSTHGKLHWCLKMDALPSVAVPSYPTVTS